MPYLIHKIWYQVFQSTDEVKQVEVEYTDVQREQEDIIICDSVEGTDHDRVCKKGYFTVSWNIRSTVESIQQCKIYFAVPFFAMPQ